jgi:hypothetical protein
MEQSKPGSATGRGEWRVTLPGAALRGYFANQLHPTSH